MEKRYATIPVFRGTEHLLVIRDAQTKAFYAAHRAHFAADMVTHLRAHFPAQTAHLGDRELGDLIHKGVERAAHLGITRRGDVARYLNLCAAAGWNFEKEPKYSEVAGALASADRFDASARLTAACALFQRMLERSEETARVWRVFHERSQAKVPE